jgi:hypothetical protein
MRATFRRVVGAIERLAAGEILAIRLALAAVVMVVVALALFVLIYRNV